MTPVRFLEQGSGQSFMLRKERQFSIEGHGITPAKGAGALSSFPKKAET